jgi:hypothetical protein
MAHIFKTFYESLSAEKKAQVALVAWDEDSE